MSFLPCLHAGPDLTVAALPARRCLAPQLLGHKVVTADVCSDCLIRNRTAEGNTPPAPLVRCTWAERAEPGGLPILPVAGAIDCAHPDHGWTTPARCVTCPDYIPEQIHPDLPLEHLHAILSLPPRRQSDDWWKWANVQEAQRQAVARFIAGIGPFPDRYSGRGIVVVGGGRYFASAYVTIRVLRHVGCRLPIELWHLSGEIDETMRELVEPWDVVCRDAEEHPTDWPFPFLDHWWRGWQLKAFALLYSSFREVLLLDADSYPVRDPADLFDWTGYRELGAAFWPDPEPHNRHHGFDPSPILGVAMMPDLATESGQLLVDKEACWRELNLAAFYNARADFIYRLLYGDKDTFPLAWARLGRTFARPWPTCGYEHPSLLQRDPRGRVLFQHRVSDKFRISGTRFDSSTWLRGANAFYPRMEHELFCFQALEELQETWAARA